MWLKKPIQMNLFMKQKQTQETQKINVWLQKRREVRGGTNKEFGISRYKIQTTIYKTDKQQEFTV